QSFATNLVPRVTNSTTPEAGGIFIRDRQAGTTTRVSVATSTSFGPAFDANSPSMTPDGRFVPFESRTQLDGGDTNGVSDVFVRDRLRGITERVSVSSSGAQADRPTGSPSISADGRFVAFGSFASTLAAPGANGFSQIFVRDRTAGTTERVSVSATGALGNG